MSVETEPTDDRGAPTEARLSEIDAEIAELHEPGLSWFDESNLRIEELVRERARLLKPYGIRSGDIRTASGTLKGFKREDFIDAWGRYLPPPIRDKGDNGSVEPKTGGSLSATEGELSRIESGRKPHGNADVADVADRTYNEEPATPAEEAEIERIAAKLGGAA